MLKITPFNHKLPRRRGKQEGPFSDFFDNLFGLETMPMRNLEFDTFKLNVKEEEDHFLIEAHLPGIKKEEVFLDYYNGNLSISIETEELKVEEQAKYVHRESVKTSMRRTINIGDINDEEIEAELKDGILVIKAPKCELIDKTSRIAIK